MSGLSRWGGLSSTERRVLLDALLEALPAWLELRDAAGPHPRFLDRRSGERWRLFPGGAFVMGATPERVLATEALLPHHPDALWSPEVQRPPRPVEVGPFLLMEEPVRGRDGTPNWYLGDVVGQARGALAERGVRLPTEAEWEYAHREALAVADGWVTGDMELCADAWRPSLEHLEGDGRPPPGQPGVCRQGSLDPLALERELPARMPLPSVRLCQLRAALDVPLTLR